MAGAPEADKYGRFLAGDVLAWIDRNTTRIGSNEEMRKLRESKLRSEAEEAAFDLGVKKGEYVAIKAIVPAIAEFNERLTADMRALLEFELPAKLRGKSLIQIQQMLAEAIDKILRRLKSGQRGIAPEGGA